MLEVQSISCAYDGPVIQGVSFDLKAGEIIGVVGKSGAGKTTLLKAIAGLLEPREGAILLDGEKVLGPAFNLVPGHADIKLVNQDFDLDLFHTTRENIREKILYLPIKEREELVEELLDLIELEDRADQKAITLSGGEQQRLALARALAAEPKVILLDEPFVHLDFGLRLKIANYLLKMKEVRGTSFVLVSHDEVEVLSLCDRIIYLDQGKVQRIDTAEHFYYQPESYEEASFFGLINEIQINGEKFLFRPAEYVFVEDDSEGEVVDVTFVRSQFSGMYYLHYFETSNKELIVLFHTEIVKDEKKIKIKRRNSASFMA